MLGEFREEYLQEILDPVFRHITLKTEEEMNLLSPDALYAGFLGALFGSGVESVDAAINGLSAESTAMDSSTKDSDYAEFAGIFEDLEGLDCITLVRTSMFFFIDSSIKKKCGSGFCPLPHGVNLLISFSFCAEPQLQPVRPR